ncbi:MAG: (d)CMP kinase [Alphaproteobacteria bacterium]
MSKTRTLPSGLKCTVDDTADVVRNPLAGVGVAVDGVYASGKGTLAITLARLYRLKFLDTGTLYRAVAYKILKEKNNPSDRATAAKAARELKFDFKHKGNNVFGVWVDGEDVTDKIRLPDVATNASVVAIQPDVRAALLEFQKQFGQHWQPLVGVIMDGRDIGARIMPQAQVKLFLAGDVEVRARRRWLEYAARGAEKPLDAVVAELLARDGRDEVNTIQCPDAAVIDTTYLDAAGVLKAAEDVILAKLGGVTRGPVGG